MRGMSAHHHPFKIPSAANSSSSSSPSFLTSYDGGIRTGILSPALSSATSTSVTPITPMTPLTTPRTPAQALLGRHGVGHYNARKGCESDGGHHQERSHDMRALPSIPQHHHGNGYDAGSHDHHHNEEEKQLLALQLFSNFLHRAESTLQDVTERENAGFRVIGPGIIRLCHDLADGIEEVAKELRRESEFRIEQQQRKRRQLPVSELDQVMPDHDIRLIDEGLHEDNAASEAVIALNATNSTALALSTTLSNNEIIAMEYDSSPLISSVSHEDYVNAISTAHTLLLDMAGSLRAITQEEAQELGEVALEVAHMFVWSLKMVHRNMIQIAASNDYHSMPPSCVSAERKNGIENRQHRVTWSTCNISDSHGPRGLGPLVEIFGEEEKKDEHNIIGHIGTPPKNSPPSFTPQLSPIPSPPRPSSFGFS